MRYDRRYFRVFNIITAPEVPRFKNGGIALCHWCQRSAMFANGFLNFLLRILDWEIREAEREQVKRK